MERKYVAIVSKCEQVSPDDFQIYDKVLQIDDSTTIGQIKDWYLNLWQTRDTSKIKVEAIRISQVDTPLPEPPKQ